MGIGKLEFDGAKSGGGGPVEAVCERSVGEQQAEIGGELGMACGNREKDAKVKV